MTRVSPFTPLTPGEDRSGLRVDRYRPVRPLPFLPFRRSAPIQWCDCVQLLCPLLTSARDSQGPSQRARQISRGKLNRLPRTPAGFTAPVLDGCGLRGAWPTRPTGPASYPVSVRRVAILLHASFGRPLTEPSPCASLALRLHQAVQGTCTPKLLNMLDTPRLGSFGATRLPLLRPRRDHHHRHPHLVARALLRGPSQRRRRDSLQSPGGGSFRGGGPKGEASACPRPGLPSVTANPPSQEPAGKWHISVSEGDWGTARRAGFVQPGVSTPGEQISKSPQALKGRPTFRQSATPSGFEDLDDARTCG